MLEHVTHTFYNRAYAIQPEKLLEMQAVIERKLAGESIQPPTPQAGPRGGDYKVVGRTAILPIFGIIEQRMNLLMAICGGTSTELVGKALDQAVADQSVKSILLLIDSPGGSVFGVEELGAKILAARAKKRIVAVADSLAASAAYWIGSQASEFYATPGGLVGSVGVYLAHRDESAKDAKDGVKTELISAGQYKTEGDPSQPLSEDARAHLQSIVDDYYSRFVNAVAKGRGLTAKKVLADFGQGRVFPSAQAQARGMVDKVQTTEQVLRKLGADGAAAGAVIARARAVNLT